MREGRILKIYTKAEGEKEDIPVRMGRDAEEIPNRHGLFPAPGNGGSGSRTMNSSQQAGVGNQLNTRARQNQSQVYNTGGFGNGLLGSLGGR